jgi:hypothetical protein
MQRFMAELSRSVDPSEFEKSWLSDPKLGQETKVEFSFEGLRVSACIHTEITKQWPSIAFRQSFSAAIRRINSACNVRWL